MERREIARKVAKLIKIKFIKFDGHYEDTVRISAKLSRRLTRRLPRDIAPSNQKPLSLCAFPRFWSLFPIILPRSVRIRVYDPAHQELLEDYLLDRKRFRTKRAKRWVTFSYTLKTAVMVGQSLNAWLGDGARKALKWIGIAFLGNEGLKGLRGLLYELMRRM